MSSSELLNPDAYYVTKDGFKKLEDDLVELKNQRPAIAESLRVAMQDKDFRENAPLDAARDAQAHLEAKIRNIEAQIRTAVIISADDKGTSAHIGSKIKLDKIRKKKNS